jgi:hypothetical protein
MPHGDRQPRPGVDDSIEARWSDFPVDAVPRPIVLLDHRVLIEGGFADADSKLAWLDGAIDAAAPVPAEVIALLPSRRAGIDRTALTITAAVHVSAAFRCDRGPRELPAYRLRVSGLNGFCVVLSPEVRCWWPQHPTDRSDGHRDEASVDGDGVTVRFPAHGGVLTEFHGVEFEEHAGYVIGRPLTSERPVAPGTAVPLVGIRRIVTGRLSRPLDGRVLLTSWGQPLMVTPL